MLSPFRGFRDLQSEMDRMMGEAFGRLPRRTDPTEWAPAVDAVVENGNLVTKAGLPSMKREDLDISFHNGVLTVSGEHKKEHDEEHKDSKYLLRERRYGSFRRSMNLPQSVDEDNIKASFKVGVLEVTVEGGASEIEEQPKRIKIEGDRGVAYKETDTGKESPDGTSIGASFCLLRILLPTRKLLSHHQDW